MFVNFTSPINAGAIAMIAGLIVVPVVSLLTPKMPMSEVNAMFDCYNEAVTVSKKDSLEV